VIPVIKGIKKRLLDLEGQEMGTLVT